MLSVPAAILVQQFDGNIFDRKEIGPSSEDDDSSLGPIAKLLRTVERWIESSPAPANAGAIGILRILALFEQPATMTELAAFQRADPIPELGDGLGHLSQRDWRTAITTLVSAKLISKNNDSTLGAHPLVRMCVDTRLRRLHPEAWRAGHSVLFEYFQRICDRPETLEEMTPLYRAVHHGCESGLHSQALEVFKRRIRRDDAHYSFFSLGAVMSDLSALSHFFVRETWDALLYGLADFLPPGHSGGTGTDVVPHTDVCPEPVVALSTSEQAYVLNEVGSALRFMGYPRRAIPLIERALYIREEEHESVWLCRCMRNLSKSCIQSGLLADAETWARKALVRAPPTLDKADLYISMSNVARVYHCRGEFAPADEYYRKAEAVRQARNGGFTLQETHFCEFLIEQELVSEAAALVKQFDTPPDPLTNVLNHGLYFYSSALVEAALGRPEAAKQPLAIAIDSSLPKSLRREELGEAYLARATNNRRLGDLPAAQADLNSAFRIAEAGALMPLAIDCRIERCELLLANGRSAEAEAELRQASNEMNRIGYLRRRGRVESLQTAISA